MIGAERGLVDGVQIVANSLIVEKAILKTDTSSGGNNGKVVLKGVLNDTGTSGGLKTSVLADTVTVTVSDAASFNVTLSLTGCTLKSNGKTIKCKSSNNDTKATLTPRDGLLGYKVAITGTGLSDVDTGTGNPTGPVMVVIAQNTLSSADLIGDDSSALCAASGTNGLRCKE